MSTEPFTPDSEHVRFVDREDAGRQLADALVRFRGVQTAVLGIPRGGAVIAAHVARRLGAHLDVWIARKIAAPEQPELGIGAIAEGGGLVVDGARCDDLGITPAMVVALAETQRAALIARVDRLRSGVPPPSLEGRVAIIVDDGVATGVTMRAVIHDMRTRGALRIVVATPVGATAALDALEDECDEVVALLRVEELGAVGRYYDNFEQVSDDAVAELLHPLA